MNKSHLKSSTEKFVYQTMTSKKGSWISLAAILAITALLFTWLSSAPDITRTSEAPAASESKKVEELLTQFPASESALLIVATSPDGADLSQEDLGNLAQTGSELNSSSFISGDVSGPMPSEDSKAAILFVPVDLGTDDAKNREVVEGFREEVKAATPDNLELLVTGGPAFGADVAASFKGADFTLLAVTVAIVAVLLILTYRSPVLWLVPLIVVGVADRLASLLNQELAATLDFQFEPGIVSVLVFGAGTNYALLLISRYREELHRLEDARHAMARAWTKALPAILASNLTVVFALLILSFAEVPLTNGLAIPAAAGLLVALLAVMLVLAPVLSIFGRKLFWPYIPKFDANYAAQEAKGFWHTIATKVTGKAAVSLVAGGAVLAIMLTGLFGTTMGLNQVDKFRISSESSVGLEVLEAHFPAGLAQSITVLALEEESPALIETLSEVEGVEAVRPGDVATIDGKNISKITLTPKAAPGTDESMQLVADIRSAAAANNPEAEALVGGQVAAEYDMRQANDRDLKLIPPLIVAVIFVVLLILLRSLVAPLVLLVINLISSIAAIGAGAWIGRTVFGWGALDTQVPILAFLFLVALGIDYTIFLVHRARLEIEDQQAEENISWAAATKEAMIRAVSSTGSVITSAGVVLAGVFAALGVLPLMTLGQLGVIIFVGVLVDTIVVRTVIVPAVFTLAKNWIWWPKR